MIHLKGVFAYLQLQTHTYQTSFSLNRGYGGTVKYNHVEFEKSTSHSRVRILRCKYGHYLRGLELGPKP